MLGEMPLSAASVAMFTTWVNGGGNLIAMRPDKQLAGLLGLTDAAATLPEAYLQVQTASAPGAGIVAETMQFHGTADRYTPSGATTVATLFSTATTADRQSRGHRPERRFFGGPGGGFHLRSRAVRGADPPGQPGLGRSGTRRSGADPIR